MNIELLLHHMFRSKAKAVYFLGAGASFGLMPTMRELPSVIAQRVFNFPSFDTGRYPDTSFRRVLYPPKQVDALNWNTWKRLHTNETALLYAYDSSFIHSLSNIVPSDKVPSQIAFFNLCKPGSVVITLNTDGLLKCYVKGPRIIELHGSVLTYKMDGRLRTVSPARIPRLCRRFEKEESLTVECGIRALEPLIVRPSEPERSELVPLWAEAAQVLRSAEVVFVIGYSFSPYDQPVRTLFKNALERRQCPVYVLDRNAFEIAGELMEFLKQSEVIPWDCDWRAFSEAICRVITSSSPVESKEVIRTYDKTLGL